MVTPLSKATRHWVILILVTIARGRLVASKESLARTVQPLWEVKWDGYKPIAQ